MASRRKKGKDKDSSGSTHIANLPKNVRIASSLLAGFCHAPVARVSVEKKRRYKRRCCRYLLADGPLQWSPSPFNFYAVLIYLRAPTAFTMSPA